MKGTVVICTDARINAATAEEVRLRDQANKKQQQRQQRVNMLRDEAINLAGSILSGSATGQSIGAGVGAMAGDAILSGVGGAIGSTLGGLAGGLFEKEAQGEPGAQHAERIGARAARHYHGD